MVFVDIYERGHFFLGEIIKENDDELDDNLSFFKKLATSDE